MVVGYSHSAMALLLCLIMLSSSLQALVFAGTSAAAGGRPAMMFVFGDSTLDVGNNNYLPGPNVPRANMPYYGIDFPGSLPTGRFSNGYNIADYLAKSMGFASSPPPYLSLAPSTARLVRTARASGVSYASGGAGILDSTNAGNNIPLSKQVQYFKAGKTISAKFHRNFRNFVFIGHQVPDGHKAGLPCDQPPALQLRLPLQHRQQRPVRLCNRAGGVGVAEQVSRRPAARRRHAVLEPHFQLLSNHHGAACDGREEVRHHQRGAAGLRPRGAAGRRRYDGRMLGQPEQARVGPGRRPRVAVRQPRLPAAGPHLLARRLLRPVGGHLRGPGGVGVHGRRRRLLRRREARRRGGLPAQRHGVQQPRPARVLGPGASLPVGCDAGRAKLLR